MPRGDRTGPWGAGPMTGRGAGFCAGYPVPGYMNPGWWYPWGGRGRGRGYRYWYRATGVPGWARFGAWGYGLPAPGYYPYPFDPAAGPADEKKFLQQQAEYLEEELRDIEGRLVDLEKKSSEEEE